MNEIKYSNSEVDKLVFDTKNISIVGANGSGKSTLMRKISQFNDRAIIVSAQKNLSIKQGQFRGVEYSRLNQETSLFEGPITGSQHKPTSNNIIQNDFSRNIESIIRDHNDKIIKEFKRTQKSKKINYDFKTKLDKVIEIWNSIFLGKYLYYQDEKLMIGAGGFKESNEQVTYNTNYEIEELSDGERVSLYILLKAILANDDSIIVIDEPETFLNSALLDQLFDEVEMIRADCKFIYFSHDLEFVTTRKDNTIFWIKDFIFPATFDISKIDREDIPNELIIKVIGTKKEKILFVESTDNKDAKLYQLLYPDFKVWPVDSCQNVINYTKAFNSDTEKFDKQYFGLIDGDFRSDEEIDKLNKDKIFVIPVSIFENLFFIEDIVIFVLEYLGDTKKDKKINSLKKKILEVVSAKDFKDKYKKSKIQNEFNQQINILVQNESKFEFDFKTTKQEIESFKNLSYGELIKIVNTKSIKPLSSELGYKWGDWQNQVLNIFNTDKGDELQKKFLQFMPEIT